MNTIELSETIDRLTMRLLAHLVGHDWNIIIYGGDRPHIGAVALASPDRSDISCSLICLPDHREGELAKRAATAIAAHTNTSVCVSCGVHLENITYDEILSVNTIVESFIEFFKNKTQDNL
jgi:hypothetical protein